MTNGGYKEGIYARDEHDWYVEPVWVTEKLLNYVDLRGCTVIDPCCGQGNILEALGNAEITNFGFDLIDHGCGVSGINFMTYKDRRRKVLMEPEHVVFNPPYKHAKQFIEIALERTEGIVAAFLELSFLASQGRGRFFKENRPTQILILSRRPSCPPGGQGIVAKGGRKEFMWVVWDNRIKNKITKTDFIL